MPGGGAKMPKIPGPKMPKASGMPKMPAGMPTAPRMRLGGTPNLGARAMRAPRLPRMGGIKP